MASISEALAVAIGHHHAGRLQIAEQIYRQILLVEPQHAEALHRLGAIAHQTGRYELAVEYFGRSVELVGNVAAYHSNLGVAYQALGRASEAIGCYRRALELVPDFADAHNHLGFALRDQGDLSEAAASYRRALELKPDFADAHNNLGVVLRDQGLLDEAVASLRRAVELKPDYAVAYSNLGVALANQGKLDEAVVSYYRALQLQPDFPQVLNNLGNALSEQGKPNEAVACFRRALELNPDIARAHNNLGNALRDLGMLDEAAACSRRAVELRPDDPAALSCLVHALQHLCQWSDLSVFSDRLIEMVARGSGVGMDSAVSPLISVTLPTATTAEQQLQCARQWVDCKLQAISGTGQSLARIRATDRQSRIKVGYLSADFHGHATAWLIAELFEKHDRERFTICGYSYGPDDKSPMRQRLIQAFDRFVDIRDASSLQAAQRIAADEVDILVDLKGYTQGARTQIVALRPAPIQVNYLGYPGTTGAPFMDYIVVDDFIVPSGQQPFFTEKLVHLPGCYQVNDSRREIAAQLPSRRECGLPEQGFIFCSFNNSYKITPEMFGVWMELLQAVPDSVLWLLEGNRFVAANLRREAQQRGVAPERLVFAPRVPLPDHLARHRLADLFLDSYPVNAHTTASDALWTGCPVLTLTGETFVSRVAGSLLRALDLPELITKSVAEYRQMALKLTRDADLLRGLRTRLDANREKSGLFNGEQFARKLERAYATMWERFSRGEAPRPFAVSLE